MCSWQPHVSMRGRPASHEAHGTAPDSGRPACVTQQGLPVAVHVQVLYTGPRLAGLQGHLPICRQTSVREDAELLEAGWKVARLWVSALQLCHAFVPPRKSVLLMGMLALGKFGTCRQQRSVAWKGLPP